MKGTHQGKKVGIKNTRVRWGHRSEIALLGGQSPVAAATHDSQLQGIGKEGPSSRTPHQTPGKNCKLLVRA